MPPQSDIYFITLATGRQGTSTANELLKKHKTVRAFVRNKTTAPARALEALGCVLIEGSADDPAVINQAMDGVTGLFLNIFPNSQDPTAELRQARNFLDSAKAKGVKSVVVTTALHTCMHQKWLLQDPNYPMAYYYGRKLEIENAVRNSGIQYTILRPGWLMHDYLDPLCQDHFPNYKTKHILDVGYPPGTLTAHFAPYDVGKFASAAFLAPEKFAGHEIELGNEQLTIDEVAQTISKVMKVDIKANYLTPDEVDAISSKAPALAIRARWGIEEGAYTNDPSKLMKYHIPLISLEQFLQSEKEALAKTLGTTLGTSSDRCVIL